MIILYMYLILLYIIIIFLLFLYNNNIEGQNGDKPNITLNFSYRITSNNDDDDINNFSLDISKLFFFRFLIISLHGIFL